MNKLAKALTGITLVVAAFVIYLTVGGNLKVSLISSSSIPASERSEAFNNVRSAARGGNAGIEVYVDDLDGGIDEYEFVTLTYEVTNYGLLPAEWVELTVTPLSGDVLQVESYYDDLTGLRKKQITTSVLTKRREGDSAREAQLQYYVFGRQRISVSDR